MKSNSKVTFDITRALFAVLEYDRPEISLSGIHVLLLTESFYERLPYKYRVRLNFEELKYGALLHDIGKLRIPREILNKPGKLQKEEMDLVRSHAQASAEILGGIRGLERLAGWVQYHHERMDGKGYFQLKENEIPLQARIIAITDAYSSIIMASSFKPSRTHEDAVSILKMGAGTQFDQELINIFCSIPPENLQKATAGAAEIMEKAGNKFVSYNYSRRSHAEQGEDNL